jgi:hypothetical protein
MTWPLFPWDELQVVIIELLFLLLVPTAPPEAGGLLYTGFLKCCSLSHYKLCTNTGLHRNSLDRARCELLTTVSEDHKTARSLGRWHSDRIKSKEVQSSLIHLRCLKGRFSASLESNWRVQCDNGKDEFCVHQKGLPLHHLSELHSIQLDWSQFG